MKHKYILFIFLLAIILGQSCPSFSQECVWSSHAGGISSDGAAIIGTDGVGNVYLSGESESPNCYFDTDTLTNFGYDISFIAKYDANGNEVWIKPFIAGSISFEVGYTSISGIVDTIRNEILASGFFYGSLTLPDTILYGSGQTIVLMKMDLDGNIIWARTAGGPGQDFAFGAAYDEQGNIYMSGSCSDSAMFGSIKISPGGFLAKYDGKGKVIWAMNKFRYYNQYPQSPSFPFTEAPPFNIFYSQGELLINGNICNNTVIIDTISIINYPGFISAYISAFDTNGQIKWINCAGGPNGTCMQQFTTDTSGNVLITGYFTGYALFGTDTLSHSIGSDFYLAKYSTTGVLIWVKQLNPIGGANGNAVESDRHGGIYLSGNFIGTAIFGHDTLSSASGSNADMFVAHYSSIGICDGVRQYTTGSISHFSVDNQNNIVLAGNFKNTLAIGPNTFTSYGDDDIFVAKCSAITGIEEIFKPQQTQLLIYANPTTGRCNIKIPEDFRHEKNLVLQIFDNNGRIIQNVPVVMDQEKISVNISAEAKGIYNAILSNGKMNYSGKIVFK